MKKIIIYFPFLLLFALYSCDVEPLDSDILSNANNGGNGNNDGNQNTQPSTGDYWPMAIGNNWQYSVTTDNQSQPNSSMEIDDLVSYNGNQEYLYSQFMSNTTATDGSQYENLELNIYTRKNGGNYIVTLGDMTFDSSGVSFSQTGYSYVMLKDYLSVGETWTASFSTTLSVSGGGFNLPDVITNTTINFEIMNKDFSMTVNGVQFDSVIEVKADMSSNSSGQVLLSESTYFFAKDVGVIKAIINSNDVADNVLSSTVQELTTYNLN